jgi:hypothetical protein
MRRTIRLSGTHRAVVAVQASHRRVAKRWKAAASRFYRRPLPAVLGGRGLPAGGVVLVARNPASKELPKDGAQLLERLREQPSPAAFLEWSQWRIAHKTTKPWPQWQGAFAKAVDGCWTPQQLAWLNVVPAPTVDNAAPSAALCDHGRRTHLAPMLTELLQPAGRSVICRSVILGWNADSAIPRFGLLTLTPRRIGAGT